MDKKAKILLVGNQKGGVGKTTTTYNIATAMTQMGKRVCMVDLDSQCSLTIAAGYNPLDFAYNSSTIFETDTATIDALYDTEINNLSLIPSSPLLAGVETALVNTRVREYKLKKALEHINLYYDCIILDCPPHLGLIVANALACSDYLVIPCETSPLAYYALENFVETITGVIDDLNPQLQTLGIIATLHDSRCNLDKEVLTKIKANHNHIGTIQRLAAAKKGFAKGLPVVMTHPKSTIAAEYTRIASTLMQIMNK